MIPTTKLVYDFERKYNQSGRGDRKRFNLVDTIGYLNESQGIWFEQLAHLYQTSNYMSSELQQFQESGIKLTFNSKNTDFYSYSLPLDMYKRLNQKATVCDPKCCGEMQKTIPIKIVKSDEINEVLIDPLEKPSFAWERLSGIESGNNLNIYSDQMEVKEVAIDYLRFPKELHAPSLIESRCSPREYENYAGRIVAEDQDFESTSRFSDRKIVDIAVMLAHGDRKDYDAFQKQLQVIMFGDNKLK